MKKLFILILIPINFTCYSQQNTFSKLYNPYNKTNSNSLGIAIEKKGNGYVTVAVGVDSVFNSMINYKMNIIINEMDSIGTVTKTTTFAGDSCDYWGGGLGALIKTKDGGFFIPCSISYSENNSDHFLIRFDSNMDTLWTRTIDHDTIWEIYYHSCETFDKGFALVGLRVISPSLYNVLLAKTDSLGNKLWERTISMGYWSTGSNILETPDKGFLIKGYKSWNIDGYGDPFVIKTDSIGNILWYRFFGNPNEKDGSGAIVITSGGDYLFAYGYSTHTFFNNEGFLARLNVVKLNPDGYTIWDRMYDTIRDNTCVMKIQNLPDNDFIVMGVNGVNKYISNFNYIYYVSYLFKFNSSGDSLWRKTYNYTTDGLSTNKLNDNVLDADGGLTAFGYVQADTMYPLQKIWILKTDSNGYAPGPQNVSIIDLPYMQMGYGGIKVFPNPATTQTTITYNLLNKESQLQIYNMLGQLIYEEKLPKSSSQITIDTRAYKKGLYKVVVGESSGTLVIAY